MAQFAMTITIANSDTTAYLAAAQMVNPKQAGETNNQYINRFVSDALVNTIKDGLTQVAAHAAAQAVATPAVTVA